MPPITACAGMPSAMTEATSGAGRRRRAADCASAATQHGDRDRDQHERQHPVAELDRAVHAELAVRRRTTRRCSVARSGSPARSRSAVPRRRSPRSRCWRPGWPTPAGPAAGSGALVRRASLPSERPRGQGSVPSDRPCRQHDQSRHGSRRRSAARIASPSAPDGQPAATTRRRRRTPRREHDGAAGEQQQVDQVRRRQGRLGAQRAGEEQAERGERRRAEQDREDAHRRTETSGVQPSSSAATPITTNCSTSTHEQRADLAAQQPGAGQGSAPSRLSTP